MGHAKEWEMAQAEDREFRWSKVCESKGYTCKICGEAPIFEEREAFFENGHICAHCKARHDKLMRE